MLQLDNYHLGHMVDGRTRKQCKHPSYLLVKHWEFDTGSTICSFKVSRWRFKVEKLHLYRRVLKLNKPDSAREFTSKALLFLFQCLCFYLFFKTSKSNFSKAEWKALKSLKSRPDIVIKLADKGVHIVDWCIDSYAQEGHSQLNSPSYKKLDNDPTKSLNNQIINTISEDINYNSLPPNANKLYSQHPRTSLFYVLPKIHKTSNPGRPIVSAVSCYTSQITTYLDHLLTPIVKQLPTYVKDSLAALRVFNNF